jgi:hypothetical protein
VTSEETRLTESRQKTADWKRWGPYVSERAWGTVREDYSAGGDAWEYFPHEHARSKVYRWNEDGLAGICDNQQEICFALALWNEVDPILKERLFGLTGNEGNHGEDVKEYYFYLDSTPTHSYMKFLYKYPQAPFPYTQLLDENRWRSKGEPEYELADTGVFDDNHYFDVVVEYAKASPEDILIRISATNRGGAPAPVRLLPTLWFRNTWSWRTGSPKPRLSLDVAPAGATAVVASGVGGGRRYLYCQNKPTALFTENETNSRRLYNDPDGPQFAKDGINDCVVNGDGGTVNPALEGTKAAVRYAFTVGPGQTVTVKLRLTDRQWSGKRDPLNGEFDRVFKLRQSEADEYYAGIIPEQLSADGKRVMRQAFAGLLWSKQFYHYMQPEWLNGDPTQPAPPPERRKGRNHDWTHIGNADVISMPDKWEYPWYAAWDLAFHCVALAVIDSDFAKEQLVLLLREWYMHPNGQLPAYEWNFGDVNPPVHAWAAWRVYKIEQKRRGVGDRAFLERVFHKLLLNFNWWVNRKDAEGMNIFEGGFLGLDNIGVFDRSAPLPAGGHIEQSDGTSWMGMYTLNLLTIALELARENPVYEDVATKFFEHFLYIAKAMHQRGGGEESLWNEDDGFFYDVLSAPDGARVPMKVRSMVGLIPLFAVETFEPEMLDMLPDFKGRLEWFIQNKPELTDNVACMESEGRGKRRLLSVVDPDRLRRVLRFMLDESEFLSPYGIRAVSRVHREHPYSLQLDGMEHRVDYEPGESRSNLFGGNSNWRGPIWFPVNYLLIESLQKFHHYLGDNYKVDYPTGSGQMMTLKEIASDISRRLNSIFLRGEEGRRAVNGERSMFQQDPHWRDLILFYEYFHGDTGAGVGASHQTGWTALVAKLLQQSGEGSMADAKSMTAAAAD